MAKSYDEILEELNKKSKKMTYTSIEERSGLLPFANPISAKEKQKNYEYNEKKLFESSNDLKESYARKGIVTGNNGFIPTADRISYLTTKARSGIDYNNIKLPSIKNSAAVELDKDIKSNEKNFNILNKTKEFQDKIVDVQNKYDTTANSYYDFLQQKVVEDNIGIIDKTIGVPIRGALGMLSTGRYSLKNEKGESYIMPTYSDLKQQKVMESYKTGVGKLLGSAGYELGKIATSAALNAVVPGSGSATYFGNIYADQLNNSIAEGYDTKNAMVYATLGTAAEVITGKILGGTTNAIFGTSGSEMSQVISKGLSKAINGHPRLVNAISNAIAEGSEEFVQEFIDKFNRNLTLDTDNGLFEGVFTKETLEDAIYSAAVGAITGSVSGGMDGNDYYKLDKQKSQFVEDMTTMPRNNTTSEIIEKDFINSKLKQEDLGNVKLSLNNNSDNVFRYLKSDNIKSNNLKESASKYFNNSQQSQNFINSLDKIVQDKNYNVLFDSSISNNKQVNAQIKTLDNGEIEIRLNPNSPRCGEFLIMHEVTHAIETAEMKELIINYASKHSDFNSALESLKQTYGVDDVTSEVVADISGQLFGNQEFINSLTTENTPKSRNIIKTIYEGIKRLLNGFTEKGQYRNFLQDLEFKWRDAYRTQNNNLQTQMFSIQLDSKGNKYVNIDTDQDIFNGIKPKDYSKVAKQYILDNFRENGININNENVNVTSKTAKEYTHSKTILPYYIKDTKMKASTELDNLLNVSDYKYSALDDGRHPFAKDGWDYYKTTFTVGNKSFEGLINIGKNGNKKTLYDITNIKEIPYISASDKSFSESVRVPLHKNNITQSNDNVKLPTKYSMQESKNNTQELDISSFSLINHNGKQLDISNIKETNYMKQRTFNRKYNKDTIITYRGAGEDGGTGVAFYGLGLYTTLDKNYASQYGKVDIVDNNLLPNSPLHFKTQNDFHVWEQELAKQLNIRKSELYGKDWGIEQYLNKLGYDGLMIGTGKDTDLISFTNSAIKYSRNNSKWQEYLENNYKATGTRTDMNNIKLPKVKDNKINIPISNGAKSNSNKILNPIEISNLTKENANTTPVLPTINNNKVNDGDSKFFNNIKDKTNMLNEGQKFKILSNDEVKYYDKITNKESLEVAFERLNKNGSSESLKWFGKDSKSADATDVAEGWILLKQYADNNDYDSMVEVAKKMRDIGSKAGQTIQAFNIMERMTPEGMVKYAQSELTEAYNKMVKNKSKEWIDKYRSDFDLKPNEVQFIMDAMKEVSTMEDGYDKRVKLAEIQKIMTDKLPPQKGAAIKSWMRISMLFNPKTQVRNVFGNAIIAPVNYFGDLFSSYADKLVSKKTNVRTTGNMNVKAILKGFKEGAYQATNDYKKGINTKDMNGNRFEIGEGKSFSDKNLFGRNLNRVEGLLNYVMDAGDRMFSQSSFENSLQNQMILNNTTEVTQEMIDIATTESLQRTWNDNNNYTKFVLDVRRTLNRIGTEKYGLGDILIPFAKTPANLTKAIVDYSPIGLVNTIIQGNNLRKSLTNGQYTPQMQHKFVQTLGKATAGTMLYIAGVALAKAGITTGESDDDKDTANFLKNTLGISSYSINIGGKSFTYDWAQPLAAPLSITANIVNSKNKETALLESIVGNLDTAGSILLEQSFLQSINDVFNNNEGLVSGLVNEILELPSRAIPTFSKQIVDLTDKTQRTSYEYGSPVKTAINSMKAKIPVLSKTLPPVVDTMGREVQRYGGKNNMFNVFLNPANVNTENISNSAKEIYRLYKETGDSSIMPRVVPYYINKNGEKIVLSSAEKAQYQKLSGKIIEDNVNKLLNNSSYKKLPNNDKKEVIKSIVDYSYNKAREEIADIPMSNTYNKINKYVANGGKVFDYYLNKEEINYSLENPIKYKVITKITDYDKYIIYKKHIETFKGENRKNNVINYINSLKLSIPQKAMFIKMYYSSYDSYNNEIINYVNSQKITKENKVDILRELGFKIENGKVYS